jgi:hypothetical protein
VVSDTHPSPPLKIPSFVGCNRLSLPSYSLQQYRARRQIRESRFIDSLNRGEASMGGSVFAMFHLDYLSCFFTILATTLLARKSWIGLLVTIANSLIVRVIRFRTSQLDLIPANVSCIGAYAFSMRPLLKERTHANRDRAQRQKSLVVPTHNSAPQRGMSSSHWRPSMLQLRPATEIGLPEEHHAC